MRSCPHADIRRCGLILLAWLMVVPRAGGLRNLHDGWLLSPADQILTMSGESGPGPANRRWAWWCELGQMQLFGMADLPVRSLGAGLARTDQRRRWTLAGRWQQTGSRLFREDLLLVRCGLRARWGTHLVVSRRQLTIDGIAQRDRLEVELEVAVPLDFLGRTGARLEAVIPVQDDVDNGQRSGRRVLARLIIPGSTVGLAANLEEQRDGTPVIGLEGLVRLADGIALGVRSDPATGSLGPTLVWRRGVLLLRTAHIVHPDLGLTHRLVLVVGHVELASW